METQMQLHSMANLRTMEVIDVNTGSKMGFIKDFKIDCDQYKILSIILPSQKVSWFSKNNYLEIPWERVQKVGVDVILVNGSDFVINGTE